jgi:cytoskeleton protein RodZ
MTENKDQSAAATAAKGPGAMLRQAREGRRITPEEAAKKLHLSVKQIVALEQDDYKTLPGPTYVRGYLRSYSQLLGLPAASVIETYNKVVAPPEPIAPPPSAPPAQVTSSDHLVKAATALVLVLVVSLAIVWWRGQNEESPAPVEKPAVSLDQPLAPEPAGRDGAAEKPASLIAGSGVVATITAPAATGAPEKTLAPETDVHPDITVAEKPKTAQNQLAPGQATISGMILNVSPTDPLKSPVRTDRALARAKQTAALAPGAPRSRLVLHAAQESWADIRDARENKLLYETVPAGRSVSIEGLAPFSVFIGNADGVKLEFNGKVFDINQYKRGQVARFTLGDKADVDN